MCGRFGVEQEYIQLALRYQATMDAVERPARYNIAPTQPVAVVLERDGERVLTEQRWGLIPHWAKDMTIGNKMINARAETIATLASFRDSFVKRRCIVPATRFYEWQKVGSQKVPHSIQRNDGSPMSFAGLWASWRDRGDEEAPWLNSCTIITTTPNATMERLHNRMPVILEDEDLDLWLDPAVSDRATLQLLLRPAPDDALHAYPISRLVNNPRNDSPEVTALATY